MKYIRLRHIILFLLMAVFGTPVRAGIQTDYLLGGNYVYNNGSQWYLKLDCGEVSLTGSTSASSYYYDLKDYQGNVRMAVKSGSSSPFMTDYYPYGGVIRKGRIGTHHRLFIGKELDKMHGLNWYDFGARMYDPTLGRFMTMDPLAEKYYNVSPYNYCANNPINYIDINGDSLTIDKQSILAIYNGLADGSNITLKFNNGVLDPTSISDAASNTNDTFLQDLYEIAINPQMVELHTSMENHYLLNGKEIVENWVAPYEENDNNLDSYVLDYLKSNNQPVGRHIQGNTGQSLFPDYGIKRSLNKNIQININGCGNIINAQSIGIAHEFAHVLLYLRGLPSAHGKPGVDDFVFGRATLMSKRLGYDY